MSSSFNNDAAVLALFYDNDPTLAAEFHAARVRTGAAETAQLQDTGERNASSVVRKRVVPRCEPPEGRMSTVYYLSMIQYDAGLMHTTARLYMHLCSTLERKRAARVEEWRRMQQRQEEELSAMLTMVDAGTAPLMATAGLASGPTSSGTLAPPLPSLVVDSVCTESVFHRHAAEVEQLEAAHGQAAHLALMEANEQFHSFLEAAAPDYVTHALQSGTSPSTSGADKHSYGDFTPPLAFAAVSGHLVISARPVDVLVLRIINPLRGQVVGARPKDLTLAPIILEVSPLNRLADCNALSLKRYVDEDHQERLAKRVQDHLGRIAGGHHSVLLVVGGREEAERVLGLQPSAGAAEDATEEDSTAAATTTVSPELMLPIQTNVARTSVPVCWSRLEGSELFGLATSRLYGANYVLLLDIDELQQPAALRLRRAIRDSLHFAISHGSNRFSVAVLPSVGNRKVETPIKSNPTTTLLSAGDAAVLYEVHLAVAEVQLAFNCGKPPSRGGLHIAGLLNGMTESRLMPPTLPTAASGVSFNLAVAVRCFVATHPIEVAAAEAFQHDVEVLARVPE